MLNKLRKTTLCGLDCTGCEFNECNFNDAFSNTIEQKYGVSKDEVICKGCSLLINGIHAGPLQCCNVKKHDNICPALINYNQNGQEIAV